MFSKKGAENPESAEDDRRFTDGLGSIETILSSGICVAGDLKGGENVRLDGRVEGNINLESTLFISEAGRVQGEVRAKNIVVEGSVKGDVHGLDKIELRPGARVNGNLFATKIAIAEGTFFEGTVKMDSKAKEATPVRFSEKRKKGDDDSATEEEG